VHFPRLSDWLIYVVIIVAVVVVAIARRERSDAPPPPPPPAGEGLPLGPASPFDPSVIVEAPATPEPGSGTAFSIDERGVWITARHVVDGCKRAAVVVARRAAPPPCLWRWAGPLGGGRGPIIRAFPKAGQGRPPHA